MTSELLFYDLRILFSFFNILIQLDITELFYNSSMM